LGFVAIMKDRLIICSPRSIKQTFLRLALRNLFGITTECDVVAGIPCCQWRILDFTRPNYLSFFMAYLCVNKRCRVVASITKYEALTSFEILRKSLVHFVL
jgi:hypothetical protein